MGMQLTARLSFWYRNGRGKLLSVIARRNTCAVHGRRQFGMWCVALFANVGVDKNAWFVTGDGCEWMRRSEAKQQNKEQCVQATTQASASQPLLPLRYFPFFVSSHAFPDDIHACLHSCILQVIGEGSTSASSAVWLLPKDQMALSTGWSQFDPKKPLKACRVLCSISIQSG